MLKYVYMKNFLLGVFAILLISGVALAAYYYGKQSSQKNLPVQTVNPTVNPSITSQPSSTVAPTLKVEDDNELIKQAFFKKHPDWNKNEITFTVSTNNGQYASGSVTESGGGGYFFAAKVNGVWEIVADGNGTISCESLKKYPDFPNTLIPECFDEATGKSIKR